MDIEELRSAAGQRYDVEGFLVEGGMGAIYTARHRSLGSRVAIKVLPPEVASSAVRLARFKREAALAANLSHPNIVPVFEFEATPELAYLVMPYVEGETFGDQLAQQGKLDYPKVRRMLGQVANALGFAHARDVVHRDIKPANILREEAAGRWLITDFGIAHVTGPTDTEITQTGTIIGTPAYMSPEQRWGGQVDGRSDLFSLAAVAYQAICGTPTEQLPDELLKERPEIERAIRSAQPKIKPEVARVLAWPLEIAKEDRPESAEAWLEALEQAEGTKTRLKWAWAAGIAAVLIAVGLLIFGPDGPPPPTATRGVTRVVILPFEGFVQDAPEIPGKLARLLELELQFLPEQYTVLAEFEAEVSDVEGQLELARERNANLALLGRVTGTSGNLTVTVQVHDIAVGARPRTLNVSGSADSLPALLTDLRRQLLERLAIVDMDWEEGVLAGLDPAALEAYLDGEKDLREGRYGAAVAHFDEVIDSDSTFAPAHFKRMLAELFDTRPSRYSTVAGTALEAASAYRDLLPPLNQQLLAAYEVLLLEGDIDSAVALAEGLVEAKPHPETYSLLGYVLFNFRAKLGESPLAAAQYFRQAVELDSSFALALWHLAVIWMREENQAAAQQYIDRLLAVDSTSFWAEVLILGDSVLRGRLPNLPESFGNMSLGALELMIVPLGEMEAPPNMPPASREALRIFRERARTDYDRQLAFRMSMAERLASGRFAGADSLINEGLSTRVSRDEIDRWIVLSAITDLPDLTPEQQRDAVRRLEAESDAEAAWLVARWYMAEEPSRAGSWIAQLRSIAQDSATTSPLPLSLDRDIQAIQSMEEADTTTALRLWDEATQHYSVVDDFLFGLTASLWPLRWQQVEVLTASGDSARAEQALEIARTFEQMFGFVDQVAWPEILLLEIDAALTPGLGKRAVAIRASELLDQVLARDRDSEDARELRERARSKLAPPGN
ncbi:MAG: protein kinase [Gemmatimonadota bacterium]|nr:MAG: protein kinase [Gemmatimonadota bacterium]